MDKPPANAAAMRNRLAEVRRARGWTQADLLRALVTRFPACGATDAAISRWERGRPMPSLRSALMLAAALGMPVEELFPLEG